MSEKTATDQAFIAGQSEGAVAPSRTRTGPPHDRGLHESPPKPCARRITTKPQRWCLLPVGHIGDCEGVAPQEIPITDTGPSWRPNWSKAK